MILCTNIKQVLWATQRNVKIQQYLLQINSPNITNIKGIIQVVGLIDDAQNNILTYSWIVSKCTDRIAYSSSYDVPPLTANSSDSIAPFRHLIQLPFSSAFCGSGMSGNDRIGVSSSKAYSPPLNSGGHSSLTPYPCDALPSRISPSGLAA
jgi:hypothetical protein